MIIAIAGIVLAAYVLEVLGLRLGLARSGQLRPMNGAEPTVSVIVAARNEEAFIERCVASLLCLDYPEGKLEIVVVNDGSTDRTEEIVKRYAGAHPSLKVLSTMPGEGNLRGKTNAVACGIEASSGEIIMFTDADCVVGADWVRSTVGYFDEGAGVVGGFTLLDDRTMFEGVQALDWVFLFGVASATAGWDLPLTAVGNNLAVRRVAYRETGGYAAIPFSVTEDYSLVQSIFRRTRYRVRFPLDPSTVVRSTACGSWRQLYRQKQRWGVGGLDMIFRGVLIMAGGWLVRAGLVGTFLTSGWVWGLSYGAVMAAADFAFLLRPLRLFGRMRTLRYFPVFEVYFFAAVLATPVIAFFSRQVVWKERTL